MPNANFIYEDLFSVPHAGRYTVFWAKELSLGSFVAENCEFGFDHWAHHAHRCVASYLSTKNVRCGTLLDSRVIRLHMSADDLSSINDKSITLAAVVA